ncbi:MAG: hypothetical protein ACRDP8_05315 [Actinopolymorphaceae bacterium]
MRAAIVTQAGSQDTANEDWAGVAAPGLAVLLDGLSAPDGTGTGCRHGTPWYVSHLGPQLLALASDPSRSLADALAEAIRQVASLHPGCDLTHPGTPSATVVLLRTLDKGADYLALADAVLLLDTTDGLKVVSDERVDQLAAKERAAAQVPSGSALKLRRRAQFTKALRRNRNRPGGYWVAAERSEAAYEALTGDTPLSGVRTVVVATDGATRLVDTLGWGDWRSGIAALREDGAGPVAWIARTRAAEREEAARPPDERRFSGKVHDDATLALLRVRDERQSTACS